MRYHTLQLLLAYHSCTWCSADGCPDWESNCFLCGTHVQSNISGPVVLCSRSDGDPARFFDGSVAQLGEWD